MSDLDRKRVVVRCCGDSSPTSDSYEDSLFVGKKDHATPPFRRKRIEAQTYCNCRLGRFGSFGLEIVCVLSVKTYSRWKLEVDIYILWTDVLNTSMRTKATGWKQWERQEAVWEKIEADLLLKHYHFRSLPHQYLFPPYFWTRRLSPPPLIFCHNCRTTLCPIYFWIPCHCSSIFVASLPMSR